MKITKYRATSVILYGLHLINLEKKRGFLLVFIFNKNKFVLSICF